MREKNYHSRSYHKFFEDWAEWKVYDENGKMHVERIYVGNYYCSPLNKRQRIVRRVLYVLLYILSVASFIMSGIRDVPVNHAMLPSLATAVCLFPLALLALPLCRYLTAPEEMIIRQYRFSSLDLIRMSGITAVTLTVAMLFDLLFLIMTDGTPVWETLFCALGYFTAAGFTFILHQLEQRLDYKILPPRTSRPENSTVIQFESAEQTF